MTIKERLKQSMGYISETDVDDFINEFGSDFKVVVKFWTGQRNYMEIGKLKTLSQNEENSITNVFIASQDYNEIFKEH